MGKVIKQTDDGLPVFGNDDSDVLVVSNDENGLPVFSKKKAASNGGGNGLNQPSQSQSQSPLQSGSVKTFDEPALKLSDGGVPVENTQNAPSRSQFLNQQPEQTVTNTAPSKEQLLSKKETGQQVLQHLGSNQQPDVSESTKVIQPEQSLQDEQAKENSKQREATVKKELPIAYKNTAKQYFESQKITPTSTQLQQKVDELKQEKENGNLVIGHDSQGNPRMERNVGGFAGLWLGVKQGFKAEGEARKFQDMSEEDRIKFMNDKLNNDKEYLPANTQFSALGSLGQSLGSGAPLLAETAAGATIGGLLTAAAPETGGLSLEGLAPTLAFIFSAQGAAHVGYMDEYIKRYKEAKDEGLSDADAYKKVGNLPLLGEATSLATNAFLSRIPVSKATGEGFTSAIDQYLKSGIKSSGEFAGASAVGNTASELTAKASGFNKNKSIGDIALESGQQAVEAGLTGLALHAITHPETYTALPKYVRAQIKGYLSKANPIEVAEAMDEMAQKGFANQDDADKAKGKLKSYIDANKSVPPNLDETKSAVITGLIEKKKSIEAEKQKLDPAFHDELDKQIADIDGKINLAKNSDNPLQFESDDLTGEHNLNPKTHDELTAKEKEGIVVPKEYGGTEVEEIGGKGEDAETKYKPTDYFTENKGSLELKQPIEVGDKTYSDKQKAQAAADKALKQHYYENGLHDSGKPQKKQQDNGLQLQKEEETKVTEPATAAGAGGETAPAQTEAAVDEKPLSPDERISIYDKLSPEQQQEAIDAELESEGAGDKYLKSVKNGKALPNATAEEKPKEEPQAEVVHPEAVEGNQLGNEKATEENNAVVPYKEQPLDKPVEIKPPIKVSEVKGEYIPPFYGFDKPEDVLNLKRGDKVIVENNGRYYVAPLEQDAHISSDKTVGETDSRGKPTKVHIIPRVRIAGLSKRMSEIFPLENLSEEEASKYQPQPTETKPIEAPKKQEDVGENIQGDNKVNSKWINKTQNEYVSERVPEILKSESNKNYHKLGNSKNDIKNKKYFQDKAKDEAAKEYNDLRDEALKNGTLPNKYKYDYELTSDESVERDRIRYNEAGYPQNHDEKQSREEHKDDVEAAVKAGKYQKYISEGKMTADDAKGIIESAGLEVPKDILEKSNNEQGVQESDTTKKPQGTESQAPKKEQQKPEKQKDNSVVGEKDAKLRNADKGGLKATIAGVMSMVGSHTSDVAREGKGLEGKRTEKNATIEDTSKIKLEDTREVDAVTGNKVSDTKKLTSDASVKTIKEVVQAANKHDVDPYTMLAIAFQETGIAGDGDTEWNPFHLIDNRADNLIDEGAKLFKEKMKIADSKGKKTEEERIQAFNGYGKVGKHTEGQQKSLYGIDVSKEPIDMNKNPVYGKRIVDIRDNIIKKNPELVKLVEGERGNVLYDRSNASLKDEKNVGDYVAKAKSVLETLYPKAKLEVYDTEKEYLKNGGEPNTRGLGILDKNGEHRILLNLDQIKKDNSGKTAFHEVLHPIVYDAFGVSKDKLVPLWNSIADAMENVKGFEKVSEHISFYDKDQIPQEGLTELLTQIATGNIDLTDVPKSKANKIIDLVNKLFETLGIHLKLNSIEDFHSIANKIKDAFESGDAKDLKDVIKGNNIDKYITDLEKRLKDRDLSQEQYREKIEKLKSLGYNDEDIKAAFKRKGIAEEKVNEILSQTKTEKDAIQEQGAGSVLQHPQEAVGETGSERQRVESGKQGEEAAGTRTEEKQQKEVGGEPPKEPPKTGEFSSLPQKERVRGAYQHLINSDIPKDIKEKMEKEGLSPKGTSISYKVADNEESQKVGKATIQSFGVDEALSLARQGTFHPSVNSSVFAEAINHFQELESNAKTSAEKLDYAQKWADTYDEYAQQLTGAGQFSQYAYQYYKTSKLGFVISAERKFNDRRDYFTGKAEKNLKSIIEDIENEPEFQEYLKGKVADEYFKDKGVKNKVVAKLNDTAAKIRKEGLGSILPSWAKADVGGAQKQSIGGKTLDDIVATSLETIAKGIEAGEKIGDLVRDAISNIKNGGATANDKEISDWLYGQFKGTQKDATESYKERLRNQIKDLDEQITNKERKQKEIKKTDYDDETKDLIKERDEKKKQLNEVVPLQKSAEKILQKWDKKLSNLDPEKRKELLQKVLTEITQNGGLDLDTFKSMYADALGLPSLTPEMRTKLLELGGRLNSVDKATEELSKNPTQENIDAYLKAMQDGEKASSEINDLFGEKGITLDRFLNIAKLNTLGVANLVMNPLYNINFMPVRFAESLVKTGLDYGLKYMGFARDADGVYENAFYKQFGYYGGFKQGLQKSIHDVVRGQTQIDYFKKTTRQNIRPLTSLKELISHYKGENPLTKAEVANAMVEAFPTMGASAAVISRALQVGDLPFRFAAERAMAENIARQKGLSGIEKDAFVLNPNEASKKLITDAGERAVMQQDNELTKLITRLSSAFKYAGGESRATKVLSGIGKVIGATTQPFVKIPLNSAMSVLELAVPEFSAAKGIYHALHGERDLALNAFSRMAVGIAIGAAYSQIAQAGLISSTSNSPDKINASIAKEDVYGGNDLNYSAFLRWMSGGGAGWKNDDVFLNLNAFGVSGNIMALYGAKYDKLPPDQWNKLSYLDGLSNRVSSSFIDGLKNNVFSNTSTLIDAMSSGNAYSVNKWLRGSSNVLLNSFDPSWLSMASKLKNDFKVDYTAMSLKDQMASTLKERFWNKDALPKQITVWGEDRKLTPEGANPLLYYYADVTKSRRLDSRDFGYNILSLYNRTKDDSVIPSRPQKTIRQNNQSQQLNPKEYEQLQVLVGQSRKAQAQAMMTGQFQNEEGDMVSFSDLNDEQKIKILDKTYSKGYEIGKKQFLIKNPGFFQNDKK